jgi:hypothetical protein
VESIRPRVRVIQADGIKNFARELAISKPVFSEMDFRTVVRLLSEPRLPDKQLKKPPKEVDIAAEETIAKVDQSLEKVTSKINFTRREWIIVGILSVLVIAVLVILITLVIFTI